MSASLVGIYLSAHPLDEYSIILNSICNTHCSELGDKQELAKKEDVVLGGIITGVKSKFTKTGKPCGFVTLEDFEGSGELALFGEDWGKWRGIMVEGSTIYITAKCVSRYGNANYLDFQIGNVEYLQTVKENRIDRFTINVESDAIDETMVKRPADDVWRMTRARRSSSSRYMMQTAIPYLLMRAQ